MNSLSFVCFHLAQVSGDILNRLCSINLLLFLRNEMRKCSEILDTALFLGEIFNEILDLHFLVS